MGGTQIDKVQTNTARNNTGATFAVAFYNASSELLFPNVENLPPQGTMTLRLAQAPADSRPGVAAAQAAHAAGGAVVVTAQEGPGRSVQLTTCPLDGSATVTCSLEPSPRPRKVDLCFSFRPAANATVSPGRGAAAGALLLLDSWSVQ